MQLELDTLELCEYCEVQEKDGARYCESCRYWLKGGN